MSTGSVEENYPSMLAGQPIAPPPLESYLPTGAPSLLDRVVGREAVHDRASLLEAFLAESDWRRALRLWLGHQGLSFRQLSKEQLSRLLNRDIARLDQLLTEQVNAILHHPRLQQFEASWRGLRFLVEHAANAREMIENEGGKCDVRVEVLSLPRSDLQKDIRRAVEFDQSALWKKVYEEEFGMPGGEPYGALVADYEFSHHPEDVELLGKLAEIAAASFCPLVTAAHPRLLGIDDFSTLEQPLNLSRIFEQVDYIRWRSLRERDDMRFIGLTLPRVLMRVPYEEDGTRADGFRFREEAEGPDRKRYLWANSAYAFASVLLRAFGVSRWFADIRGMERDVESGGVVTELPQHSFSTDRRGVAPKSSVEVQISESQEQELAQLGLIPLCQAWGTDYCVYYSNPSLHKPKQYDEANATANARISAMLQYVTCGSRFAHYLKVLARNKLGGFTSGEQLESYLNRWLSDYISPDEKASPTTKARFPLLDGRVEVKDIPGSPGSYRMIMHLMPHYQLDRLTASLRLVTRLTTGSTG